ncbi:MAG: M42 family metallopeptidase [bacterium]|nr:M42 family metallopeptidase [bacterium]
MSFDQSTPIDVAAIIRYIEQLVNTPSPTGFTKYVEQYLLDHAKQLRIPCTQTKKGAVVYSFERPAAKRNVMFAAHVDTLGAMVKSVQGGVVKIANVGSWPAIYGIGDYCKIHTFDGTVYDATMLPDNPSVHVNKKWGEERVKIEDLHLRIDHHFSKPEEVEKAIPVGSYVSFDSHFPSINGYVKTRHLDDKASAAILLAFADLLRTSDAAMLPDVSIHLYFNITEETGQGIAAYPKEIDDLLIVDMGALGDGLQGDEYSVSICAKDSSGPYHYGFTHELVALCQANEIPFKVDVFPFYASDGSAALTAGGDHRVALIGPGIAASHGYERTHQDALANTMRLLVAYVNSI